MRGLKFSCLFAILAIINVARYQALATDDYQAKPGDSVEIQCPSRAVSLQRHFQSYSQVSGVLSVRSHTKLPHIQSTKR